MREFPDSSSPDRTGWPDPVAFPDPTDPGYPPPELAAPLADRDVPRRRPRAARAVAAGVVAGLLVGGGVVGIGIANRSSGSGASSTTVATAAKATAATASTSTSGTLDVAAIAKKAEPAIVSITTSSDGGFGGATSGSGTGMIVTSDGLVLTNAHVVEGATTIQVTITGHGTHTATVLHADTSADLALLKVGDVSGLTTVTFADSSTVQVGDPVVAIGYALDLDGAPSVTSGIVSALNRHVESRDESLSNLVQTDAAINSGNSGGPLLDRSGNVIGMNTATASTAEDVGFAISSSTITSWLAGVGVGVT